MFDFEPRSEEDIFEEARLLQPYYEWRCKDALRIFVEMREHACDAFITLDVVVLKPICLNCRYRLTGSEWPGVAHVDMVRLWPEEIDGRFRLYDAASNCVHFWPPDDPDSEYHPIDCYLCGNRINEPDDEEEIIPVVPTPFTEYFGMEEEGPKRARSKRLRRELADLYGSSCFQCKRPLTLSDITLDHIVARARGGESVPMNLQVLCESCNQLKKDDEVVCVEIALDFPLRAAPSDSYGGLIW